MYAIGERVFIHTLGIGGTITDRSVLKHPWNGDEYQVQCDGDSPGRAIWFGESALLPVGNDKVVEI